MKRKRICCLLLALLCAAMPLFLFVSCGGHGKATTLYVYNWGEYVSDGSEGSLNVNKAFEQWYLETYGERVEVNYTTYSSNEDMYAKIAVGTAGYDVIFPSDYMVARMREEGLLRPLNFENIPNIVNIDMSRVFGDEAPYYDPEEKYSVPYTYGTVGIIYNTTIVSEEDIGSWDIMWNKKYSGNILQFNNPRDAFATAMFKLGYSVNTTNEDEWRATLDLLKQQKERGDNGIALVQGYVMDEIFNKMENGSAAIAPYYAGDFFSMYSKNDDLAFFYPAEGTNVFVDAMCVPTGSEHPEIAERYINFMLSEKPAIANALHIKYASPNRLVVESEEYRTTMEETYEGIDVMGILYGTDDIPMEFFENLPQEQLTLLNDLWEELKIESSINTTIIVTAAVIIGLLVVGGAYFGIRQFVRKKRLAQLWD